MKLLIVIELVWYLNFLDTDLKMSFFKKSPPYLNTSYALCLNQPVTYKLNCKLSYFTLIITI